jgi:UDP-2-acetamido-2-deoxy-ribo-hexuluronate aminotransferase
VKNNKKIQMVDLATQYQHIKAEVDQAILDVVSSTQFINGPEVKSFQNELANYLGVKHVITCANGTDALQISMMALGLKPGDEVITPSYTYIATTEVIGLLGLKPVFVDCDPDTFNISPQAIQKAISSKTKAIVPVHLYGQACNMQEIMKIAKENDLFVIEDNAQAIGCDYDFNGVSMKTGTIGNVGCTSFFPSKNLGCFGDGGAICTNDDKLAVQLRMIANHGQSEKYYHDRIGCNSRLDSIQAAVLRIKLRELDNYIERRNKAAYFYDEAFKDVSQISVPKRVDSSNHVFHQYTLKLTDEFNRDALVQFLASKEIPAMIYYPVPAHKQKMFADLNTECGNLEVTNWLTSRVFSLPMHTELTLEHQNHIVRTIKEFIKK